MQVKYHKILSTATFSLITLISSINNCNASNQISIVSDIEIDGLIRNIIAPIFKVARLDESNINIYVISDPSVNAFVYHNSVFVHTGLIAFANNTDVLFGVLAHEVGHVTRKHITRMILNSEERMRSSGGLALAGALLMIGLSPAAASILLPGTILVPMITLGSILQDKLRYSRQNEAEADQSAIIYLKELNKPLSGLYDTMMYFNLEMSQNAYFYRYLLTHPLPAERLEAIRVGEDKNRKINPIDCKLETELRRVKAKIFGYIDNGSHESSHEVDKKHKCFSSNDLKFFKDYQVLHKLWKDQETDKALKMCNELIKQHPRDNLLIETKGNILFAMGKIQAAIQSYREFIARQPSDLAKSQLAVMLISSNNKLDIMESINISKQLIALDPSNTRNYFSISSAYHKLQDQIHYHFYLAEGYSRTPQVMMAMDNAFKVQRMLKKYSGEDKARMENISEDIIEAAKAKKGKGKGKRRKTKAPSKTKK